MFKRKLYGKKHPATRDIQAQLNMWAGVAGEKENESRSNDNAKATKLLDETIKRRSKKND